jgi:hypothetical protein
MITTDEAREILDGIENIRRAMDSLKLNLSAELDLQRARVNKLLRAIAPDEVGIDMRIHL